MICIVMWVILGSFEEEERIYSAFHSLSSGPPTFREGGSTNNVCQCIVLCVCVCEKRTKREGVGYQSETSFL